MAVSFFIRNFLKEIHYHETGTCPLLLRRSDHRGKALIKSAMRTTGGQAKK